MQFSPLIYDGGGRPTSSSRVARGRCENSTELLAPPFISFPQKIGDVGRLPKMDPVSAQCSKQQLGDFVYLKCFQVFKTSITIVGLITVFENQQNIAFEFINFGIFRQFLSY